MKLAALATLLVLFTSQIATADDNKVTSALMSAAHQKADERAAAKGNDSDEKDLPVTADLGNRAPKHRGLHGVLWRDSDYSLNVASCPMGAAGEPSFEEVRNHFRDFTDNEMWKICVNRNSYPGAVSGACACTLLAYPNPWRPVDTPHTLERPVAPPPYVPEEDGSRE